MPSELMDQRCMPSFCAPSVAFSDEIHTPPQRHVGFWKAEWMPVCHGRDGLPLLFGNMSLASQPLEKSRSVNLNSAENNPSLQDLYIEKQKAKHRHEHSAEAARTAELSVTSWEATQNDLGSRTNLFVQPASHNVTTNKFDLKGVPYENSFFASSLPPHLPSKQFALLADDTLFVQPVNKVDSFAEEEPFDSLEAKEIEAQTIGNLLPDDEDLLSGVIDELERITPSNYWNDADDDLFSSGGGMELEADVKIDPNLPNCALKNRNWGPNDSNGMEKSYGAQPSRTIFIRNVASNIEDTELKHLFQHYGDMHAIYTTFKSRGYIMVSYYDLRSACNAMASLQNKLLKNSKLDIHFSITKDNLFDREFSQGLLSVFNLDPSISNEDVHQIFGAYGEIRQIREHQNCMLVEFYDVRAAEAALHALNMSDMAGKRIEIFSGLPGGSRQSIMQHLPCEIEKIEANGCRPRGSLFWDSPSRCSVSAGTVLSNGLGSGTKQALHAVTQSSVGGFMENGYDGFSYGSSHYLSSPAGVATAGIHHHQSGFGEHSHSLGHVNIGFDTIRNFHPHSFPERHEALINGTSYSSPNTISAMGINLVRPAEGVDNMHVPRVSSGGLASLPFGCNDRAFGSLGNGNSTCQGHGNQYAWNNSNLSHQQLQSPVLWRDSSFNNNLPAQSPSQQQGLSRAHSHMLNTGVSLSQHHVGSAPTLNHSLWDRRHMYTGDLAEAFPFHPGSIEKPMISSPQMGLSSPQKFHMFHGRSSVVNMPASLDGPNDRVRSRRGDTNSNLVDNKKQYELDIDRIISGEDNKTTLMIKNIPNKYTSKMLLAAIDENHRGTYDFIYLPIDFKNKCNVGYAFINMTEAQQIVLFYKSFNGKKWDKFNSEKVASLAYARIQWRSALIAHFQNSSLMNEDKRCRPILFHADGPNAGDQEPFPIGTNIRSRPGRSRAYSSEDNHQESSSNSTDGEDTSPVVDSFLPRKE